MRVGKPYRASLTTVGSTIIVGLVLAGTLTAQAAECATYQIGLIDGTTHITGRNDAPGVFVSLEGHYLQVALGELDPDADLGVGVTSHDVGKDVIGATVCPDGSVAFDIADPAPVPIVVDIEPSAELLTDSEVAELRPETRTAYVALHPGSGGFFE